MDYKKLWFDAFLKNVNTPAQPPLWNEVNIADAEPYVLYQLPQGKIPTTETLRLQPCKRQLPLSHIFEYKGRDCALITIVFVSPSNRVFCAYTTAFNEHPVFCLWERTPSGLSDTFPVGAFISPGVLQDVASPASLRAMCGANLPPTLSQAAADEEECKLISKICIDDVDGENIANGNSMTDGDDQSCESISAALDENHIIRSRFLCIAESYDFPDIRINDPEDWDQLQYIFSSIKEEFDGVASSIVQDTGHGEYKCEFLSLKALWTKGVQDAFRCKYLSEYTDDSLFETLWLFVSGCPPAVTGSESLAYSISRIIRSIKEEKIPSSRFISEMLANGYRRPFSQLVAMHFCKDVGFDIMDTIEALSTPPSLNSYLCLNPNMIDESVYFQSSIVQDADMENGIGVTYCTDDAKKCFLTALGIVEKTPLHAHPLKFDSDDWRPRDFAKATYLKIADLIGKNKDTVVLGHVTSEQSIIDMCVHEKDEEGETGRGMSVYVSGKNSASCGHGMYFFRISDAGDFELLAANGAATDLQHAEFQSF
jgi:hypothetical protein